MRRIINVSLAGWICSLTCVAYTFYGEQNVELTVEERLLRIESSVERLNQQLGRLAQWVERAEQIDELGLLGKALHEGRIDQSDRGGVKWVKKRSDSSERDYLKITELLKAKNYIKAQQEAQHYIDIYPEGNRMPDVYFWLGEMKMLFGDLLGAKAYYQKALALMRGQERSSEVLLKLFVIASERGEEAEAAHHYGILQKKHADSTAFHMAKLQKQKYKKS